MPDDRTPEQRKADADEIKRMFVEDGFTDTTPDEAEKTVTFTVAPLLRDHSRTDAASQDRLPEALIDVYGQRLWKARTAPAALDAIEQEVRADERLTGLELGVLLGSIQSYLEELDSGPHGP